MNPLYLHGAIDAALVFVNIVLVFVGLKVKAAIFELKAFLFENFVTKKELETRFTDHRQEWHYGHKHQ